MVFILYNAIMQNTTKGARTKTNDERHREKSILRIFLLYIKYGDLLINFRGLSIEKKVMIW